MSFKNNKKLTIRVKKVELAIKDREQNMISENNVINYKNDDIYETTMDLKEARKVILLEIILR